MITAADNGLARPNESTYIYSTNNDLYMLKAGILDDEQRGSTLLAQKLERFDKDVRLEAVFNQPEEALQNIKALKLDVLFLDVEMPGINGFQFLEKLGEFDFEVIFTTAYDAYTLDALRLSVVDYLLKPVDEDELETAISRLKTRINEKKRFNERMNDKPAVSRRLALPTSEGVYFIEKSTITHVEAMSNYSTFHITSGKKIIVSKTLKEYEEVLCDDDFLRISRSAIVNLNFVVKYKKGEGGTLEMMDGKEIEVSPAKKELLLEKLIAS